MASKISICEQGSSACLFQKTQHHNESFGRNVMWNYTHGSLKMTTSVRRAYHLTVCVPPSPARPAGCHPLYLLRSAMAGRLYKLHSKHTSNSGFDQTFMPSSGYILFAAEQGVGYQILWVDLQFEVNCP